MKGGLDHFKKQLLEYSEANRKRKSASNPKNEGKNSNNISDTKTPQAKKKTTSMNVNRADSDTRKTSNPGSDSLNSTGKGQANSSIDKMRTNPRLSIFTKTSNNSKKTISPIHKSPVNIININNYNIIKPEKVTIDHNSNKTNGGYEIDHENNEENHSSNRDTNQSGNVMNYFIFVKKKKNLDLDGSNRYSSGMKSGYHDRKSSGNIYQKRVMSPSNNFLAGLSETSRSKKSINIHQHLHRKKGSGSSNNDMTSHASFMNTMSHISMMDKLHPSEPAEERPNLESERLPIHSSEFKERLAWMDEMNSLISTLRRTSVQTSKRSKGEAYTICEEQSHAFSKLKDTRNAIHGILNELSDIKGTILDKKLGFARRREHRAVGTDCEEKEHDEMQYTNLNFSNLMKEIALGLISKSTSLKTPAKDRVFEMQTETIRDQGLVDPQKNELFLRSITMHQEQLIFEETLKIMQEKSVDIEGLFNYAYDRLNITDKDTGGGAGEEIDKADGIDGVSAASFDSDDVPWNLKRKEVAKGGTSRQRGENERENGAQGNETPFLLDFRNLKEVSISESSQKDGDSQMD